MNEKPRRTTKTRYTATNKDARYIGTHPHLIGTTGVYYWNKEQNSLIYRPNGPSKTDWYRIFKENLVDI